MTSVSLHPTGSYLLTSSTDDVRHCREGGNRGKRERERERGEEREEEREKKRGGRDGGGGGRRGEWESKIIMKC